MTLLHNPLYVDDKQNIKNLSTYDEALEKFDEALQLLDRKTNPAIWDTVMWEFSSTLFTKATMMESLINAEKVL